MIDPPNYFYRYARIIAESSVILKKFKLKVTKDFRQRETQRKYSTIELSNLSSNSHSVLSEIFEKFGPNLRTLIISNSTLDDFTLLTILKSSPFLNELRVSEVVIEKKLPAINPISIVHLTSVIVHHTSWIIFQFLVKSQITSLHINNYVNEGEGTRSHLVRMLANQYRLRELTLHGTSSRKLFTNDDLNEIWIGRLTKLDIGCGFGKNSNDVDRNIVNFFILNNETLSTVEISSPNSEEITVFTLLNLDNLTSLTFDVGKLPKDPTFYQMLAGAEANTKLKHLKISGFLYRSAFVNVLLRKYPAIINLELDDWSDTASTVKVLKFVSKMCPGLQQLSIPAISTNPYVPKFVELKQLHLSYMRNIENLINFIRNNESIETLQVDLVRTEQIPSMHRLKELTQIQQLSFAGSAESLKMIFDLIQTNPPNKLKTLELIYVKFSNALRKSIQVNFSNNAADRITTMDSFLRGC